MEHRVVRPSRRHVWIAGYHRWDGNAYVWVPGRWDLPPREHAVWVAPRWRHRHEGWVLWKAAGASLRKKAPCTADGRKLLVVA